MVINLCIAVAKTITIALLARADTMDHLLMRWFLLPLLEPLMVRSEMKAGIEIVV